MILSDRDGGLGVLFNCASTDVIGNAVRISGINTVTTADASDQSRSQVLGFIITKPTPTTCYITDSLYYSGVSGFSGFSGTAGLSNGIGQPVYLTNTSGFSGSPGTSLKVLGESFSPREAILRADSINALDSNTTVTFKNKLINGAFDIWQRGTSAVNTGFTGKPDGVDRFVVYHISDATVTHQRASPSLLTHAVAGTKVEYASQFSVTVADTSLTGDQRFLIYQVVEGYNARTIAYSGFTFSFWMYGNQGTYAAFAGDNTYYNVQSFVLPNNTWTRIKITFPPNPNYAGSTTTGVGLVIGVTLALSSSSTFATATLGTWQNAGKLGTTTQTNGLAANTNIFYTSLWQVEEGPVATQFEERPFGTELALCQRYYEKSFDIGSTPTQGGRGYRVDNACADDSAGVTGKVYYAVRKRTSSVTLTAFRSSIAGNNTAGRYTVYRNGAWTEATSTTLNADSEVSFGVSCPLTVTAHGIYPIAGDWTAECEF